MEFEEFEKVYVTTVMHSADADHGYVRYAGGLWIKYRIAALHQPSKIVEIGVRGGYSAWAMLQGAPTAEYIGFDIYKFREPKIDPFTEEFYQNALRLIAGHKAEIRKENTQADGLDMPQADLYHVDGRHGYKEVLSDIKKCAKSMKETSLLAAHDFWMPSVSKAVHEGAAACGLTVFEVPAQRNGDALLFKVKPVWLSEI